MSRVYVAILQVAIANAQTLEEVERLNSLLQSGQIPGREQLKAAIGTTLPRPHALLWVGHVQNSHTVVLIIKMQLLVIFYFNNKFFLVEVKQ